MKQFENGRKNVEKKLAKFETGKLEDIKLYPQSLTTN